MNNSIDSILSIDTCEQQCVLIKDMLQLPRLEYHMKTIGIDQSLCYRSYFDHKFLNSIKKIYQHTGKCDYQQNLEDVLDAGMVSTPEEITDDSFSLPMTQTTVNKPSARKSLCLFANIFDVKKKTSKRRVGAAESKLRAVKVRNTLWTNKNNEKGIQK